MTERHAREILGVGENASFEEIKHAYRTLSKKYHPDNKKYNPEASKEKYEEIKNAFKFLELLENKKENQANADSTTLPHGGRKPKEEDILDDLFGDIFSKVFKGQPNPHSRQKKQKQNEKEKAFDDLIRFIEKRKAELKELEIDNISPKCKQGLLNPDNRGKTEVAELNAEKERLNTLFNNIIDSAKAFDKLKETIENAKKQLAGWNVDLNSILRGIENLDSQLRGKAKADDLDRKRIEIETKMPQVELNVKEFDSFFDYINSIEEKIKILEPNIDLEDIRREYRKQKGILGAKEFEKIKKKIQGIIDLKEKSVSEFRKFYEETEARIKKLYNSNLNEWEDYINGDNIYRYDEEDLNNVKKTIENYEKILKESATAYDDFLEYYQSFSKEEQDLFKSHFGLNEYLDKKNRTKFEKAVFDELKEKISKYQKEKEEQVSSKAFEEFILFFCIKEKELKKIYGIDLSKWKKYTTSKKHSIEELENVKEEIIEFEKEMIEKASAYDKFVTYYESLSEEQKKIYESVIDINKYIDKASRFLYTKATYDDLKERVLNFKKEKEEEYLNSIFKKDEFKKLYEKELRERSIAYDEFLAYYKKLSEEEKAIYESLTDINRYIDENSRFLYTKATYDDLKKRVLNFKKEKEEEYLKKTFKKDEFKKVYEKELRERSIAYDEFLAYYKRLPEEEKIIYKNHTDINRYIDKNSRFLYTKDTYNKLNKKVARFKKEQEYLKIFEEFVYFFNTKEEKLKKLYGKDLSKWKKYRDIGENGIAELESEYFIITLDIDEEELDEKSLKELQKYRNSRRSSAESLENVKKEISEYEKELEKKAKAFDEFWAYYENLSREEKEIYERFLHIDNYINKENRFLFDKEAFDDLKKQFLELKGFKEEQKKKECNLRAKDEFIGFFKEKESLFKKLYETDLNKWRKYSLKENDFTEEEYSKVKEEIEAEEKTLENERMNKLYNLQSLLKEFNINIVDYLSDKRTDIFRVSTSDLDNYINNSLNIGCLMTHIKNIEGVEERLNSYLKEQKKTVWTYSYEELFELYSLICIEIAKEEEIKKETEAKERANSYTNFINFYQKIKIVFKEKYNQELSKWDNYIKENSKENYSKKDYKNAIDEIKEEEKRLENERMSLEYNLQVTLQKVGIDISDYLNVRGKDILSVSINELKEYLKSASLLFKISISSEGRELLTSYLEENKIKIVEVDYNLLLALYEYIENNVNEEMDPDYKNKI